MYPYIRTPSERIVGTGSEGQASAVVPNAAVVRVGDVRHVPADVVEVEGELVGIGPETGDGIGGASSGTSVAELVLMTVDGYRYGFNVQPRSGIQEQPCV